MNPVPILNQPDPFQTPIQPVSVVVQAEQVPQAPAPIEKLSITDINRNFSNSMIGILDDLYTKPDTESWASYIYIVMTKDDRLLYVGLLFLFIVLFYLIIQS